MVEVNEEPKENERPARSAAVDRVAIGKSESEKLASWLAQVQQISKGFLTLTKSDLVNFLIREHKSEFASRELAQLRAHHYDPIRHINWITQELKAAFMKNDLAMVATLQEEIKGIELSTTNRTRDIASGDNASLGPNELAKTKQKRPKKTKVTVPPESLSIADLQGNSPEG